jgi:hypothetical protein
MKRTRFKPKWNGKHTEVSIFYFTPWMGETDEEQYCVTPWDLVCNIKYKKNYKIFCDNNNESLKRSKYRRDEFRIISILKD